MLITHNDFLLLKSQSAIPNYHNLSARAARYGQIKIIVFFLFCFLFFYKYCNCVVIHDEWNGIFASHSSFSLKKIIKNYADVTFAWVFTKLFICLLVENKICCPGRLCCTPVHYYYVVLSDIISLSNYCSLLRFGLFCDNWEPLLHTILTKQ